MRCTVKYGVGLLSDLYHPTCCQLTVCVRICCVLCAHAAFARLSKVCFKFSLPAIPPGKIFLSACLVPHSFIHSGHFYSARSSPLLLRGTPDYSTDTVSEFHAEAHRQLQVKDLPKVPTWRLERESNPRPSS